MNEEIVTVSFRAKREWAAMRARLVDLMHELADDCLCETCRKVRVIRRAYEVPEV